MRPQDWAELAHTIGIIRDYLDAAAELERDGQLDFGSPVEKVLRECKVHPDTRPMGQAFEDVAQVGVWFPAIGLGGFDQAADFYAATAPFSILRLFCLCPTAACSDPPSTRSVAACGRQAGCSGHQSGRPRLDL